MVAETEFRHVDPVFAIILRENEAIRIPDAGESGVQAANQTFQRYAGEAQKPHRLGTSAALQEAELAAAAEAFEMTEQTGIRIAHDRADPAQTRP